MDTDTVIKEIKLGTIPEQRLFLPYSNKTIANKYFLSLLPLYIRPICVPNPLRFLLKSTISRLPTDHYSTAIKGTATLFKVNSKINHHQRSSLYNIPEKWFNIQIKNLVSWDLDANKPFICVHCRTGDYSPSDEHAHSSRNVDINTYTKCFQYLVRQGFNIIRMGDTGMPPAPQIPGLFDYATSGKRCDQLDFVLGSGCFFYIGCSSGAALTASIFGKSVVGVGMALPFNFSYTGAENEIGIPKLFRNKKTKILVSFSEIFNSGASEFRTTEEIRASPYELVENTPDEILGVVQEIVLRKRGQWKESEEDTDLQKKIHSLLHHGSYSYGTASRCGALFLRKYKSLF